MSSADGGRPADRSSHGLLVGADGRDEEDDRGVEGRIGENRRERLLEALRVRSAEQVDRVPDAALRRHECGEGGARLLARRRQLEAERLAGVGGEDSRARRRSSPRRRGARAAPAGREQRRDVDQLVERARGSRPPRRKSASTAASEPASAAVCDRRGAGPARVAPPFSARIGLLARDPTCDARERARVAERLEVEDDQPGLVVVLPPLEQVVRRDVRLVSDRDEGGDAEAALPPRARAARARARPTATRSRSCPAGRPRGAKVALSAAPARDAMPRQFGPTSRAPCSRHELRADALPLLPVARRSRRSPPR